MSSISRDWVFIMNAVSILNSIVLHHRREWYVVCVAERCTATCSILIVSDVVPWSWLSDPRYDVAMDTGVLPAQS